jgi:hypothetical protein
MSTLASSLAWQDKAQCCNTVAVTHNEEVMNLGWEEVTYKDQIELFCNHCPVRAICRQFNDEMHSSGVVAGGKWYPATSRRKRT